MEAVQVEKGSDKYIAYVSKLLYISLLKYEWEFLVIDKPIWDRDFSFFTNILCLSRGNVINYYDTLILQAFSLILIQYQKKKKKKIPKLECVFDLMITSKEDDVSL